MDVEEEDPKVTKPLEKATKMKRNMKKDKPTGGENDALKINIDKAISDTNVHIIKRRFDQNMIKFQLHIRH